MLCCLLAALLLGPLGLWAMPRARTQEGPDCCEPGRRRMVIVAFIVIGVASLCLVAALLAWSNPGSFRHICTVLAPNRAAN